MARRRAARHPVAAWDAASLLEIAIDWPADDVVTCPVRGGFGLFVGELAIVRAMARLFGWQELACGASGERFVAQWSMPASERGGRGDAD